MLTILTMISFIIGVENKKNNGNIVLCSEYEMPSDFECIWEKVYSVNFDSRRTNKQKRIEKLFILP